MMSPPARSRSASSGRAPRGAPRRAAVRRRPRDRAQTLGKSPRRVVHDQTVVPNHLEPPSDGRVGAPVAATVFGWFFGWWCLRLRTARDASEQPQSAAVVVSQDADAAVRGHRRARHVGAVDVPEELVAQAHAPHGDDVVGLEGEDVFADPHVLGSSRVARPGAQHDAREVFRADGREEVLERDLVVADHDGRGAVDQCDEVEEVVRVAVVVVHEEDAVAGPGRPAPGLPRAGGW